VRPTHFRGVTTVVMKLLHIVQPDAAYFGQKDYQQQVIIRQMVRDLDVPVEIRTGPTIRDADGLALSSRNAYLSPAERQSGLCLWQALQRGAAALNSGERSPTKLASLMQQHIRQTPGVELDYAVVVDPWTLRELQDPQPEMVALVAARVGSTRLIDNAIWRLES
jgi:pantoate--beta-alanine ligase